MLIGINGYANPIEHQFEAHMKYDGKNKDAVNPNGKHQWCLWMQPMSKLKKEKNMAKLRATLPLKQTIAYEWCKKLSVVVDSCPYTE